MKKRNYLVDFCSPEVRKLVDSIDYFRIVSNKFLKLDAATEEGSVMDEWHLLSEEVSEASQAIEDAICDIVQYKMIAVVKTKSKAHSDKEMEV